MTALPDGLYDRLLTEGLARSLAELRPGSGDVQALKAGAADLLAELIRRQLGAILDDMQGDDAERLRHQLELVNELLVTIRQRLLVGPSAGTAAAPADVVDLVASPLSVLRAVQRDQQFATSPEIGLAVPWLFTAGKGSPSLLQEIRRELASSDQVDILVSFITVSGVRKLQDVLQQIIAVGAKQPGSDRPVTRLRILTTTYTGATEARALHELARLPGCEVRVSLDGRRTRLHAKAWLFQRKTGFGSAYVGSANLSGAALTGGLEWTVKLTQRAQESLFARAVAHFETLWADSEFQRYDPDNVEHRQALAAALGRESFGSGGTDQHDQLLRSAAQDLPARHAGAVGHRAHPRPLSQPAGGGHRHRQDGGRGIRLPQHLPHSRRAPAPAVRGPPRRDPAAGAAHLPRSAARPRVRRLADGQPPARTFRPHVRHHRQRDQPRPGHHRRRRSLAHGGGG